MIDKLGLQLYTVYKHLNDEDEIRKTFKSLKELGYDDEYANICLTHSYLNNDVYCTAGRLF